MAGDFDSFSEALKRVYGQKINEDINPQQAEYQRMLKEYKDQYEKDRQEMQTTQQQAEYTKHLYDQMKPLEWIGQNIGGMENTPWLDGLIDQQPSPFWGIYGNVQSGEQVTTTKKRLRRLMWEYKQGALDLDDLWHLEKMLKYERLFSNEQWKRVKEMHNWWSQEMTAGQKKQRISFLKGVWIPRLRRKKAE